MRTALDCRREVIWYFVAESLLLLFLDTEYNGFNGGLISMALVPMVGRPFYEALKCTDPSPWVSQNVMPNIGKTPIPKDRFQRRLSLFLCRYSRVTIVADWPEDFVHLCQTLLVSPGERLHTPDMRFELVFSVSKYPSKVPHNALEDAKALRRSIMQHGVLH